MDHYRCVCLLACVCYLVLFLIGLLDERTGDLVQLTESRNNPHGLWTALLRGLCRHTHRPIHWIMISTEAEQTHKQMLQNQRAVMDFVNQICVITGSLLL